MQQITVDSVKKISIAPNEVLVVKAPAEIVSESFVKNVCETFKTQGISRVVVMSKRIDLETVVEE